MDRKKTTVISLIVGGAILLFLSLLADVLGIGGNLDVFGWKQIVGTIVGAIAAGVGLVFLLRK